jgi:hypothetical protein
VRRAFFRSERRLANDYSDVKFELLRVVAAVNPHFNLQLSDYWDMTEDELFLMLDEFNEYNSKVKTQMSKSD